MGHLLKTLIFALLAGACGPLPPLPAIDPASDPRPPGDGTGCAETCAHWRELECVEGNPSPERGLPCEEVCLNTEEFEAQPHACFQAAKTCEQARECE